MPLLLEGDSLPYVAHCDNEDCSNSQEVFGASLQYAREDLVQTHKWQMKRNPQTPSQPLTLCITCRD